MFYQIVPFGVACVEEDASEVSVTCLFFLEVLFFWGDAMIGIPVELAVK